MSGPLIEARSSWVFQVPGFQVTLPDGCVGHRIGHILDRAADGVLAVEGSLRAAQDLDPPDIVDIEQRALGTGDIDVIDIEADAGVHTPERIGLTDASDKRRHGRRLVATGVDREVGRVRLELGDVGRGDIFEGVARDHRHRDRDLLQRLFAAARRDHDLGAERLAGQGGDVLLTRVLGGLPHPWRRDPRLPGPPPMARRPPRAPACSANNNQSRILLVHFFLPLCSSDCGCIAWSHREAARFAISVIKPSTACCGSMPKCMGTPKHFSTV